MVETFKEKINIQLIKFDNNEEILEILIRGEENQKNKGIIIHYVDNKGVDYKKICEDIKNCKLQEAQNYLSQNRIVYTMVDFI